MKETAKQEAAASDPAQAGDALGNPAELASLGEEPASSSLPTAPLALKAQLGLGGALWGEAPGYRQAVVVASRRPGCCCLGDSQWDRFPGEVSLTWVWAQPGPR